MNSTADKKNFFYIVVLILTFIAIIVGVAFAIYTFLHKQEEGSSSVYTGTLTIEYLSGNIINFNKLYPMNNPTSKTTDNVYKNEFKVTNTGTLDGILKVTLEINRNDFSDDTIKYKLFNSEGKELTTGFISGTDSIEIASNIVLKSENTSEFTLIIWLEENGENQNQEMRRTLQGSIVADANQKTD